jgi:hypothetical protein
MRVFRKSWVALPAWLACCSTFGSAVDTPAQQDAGPPAVGDAGDASTPSTPQFVRSRPSYSESLTVTVALPAGVQVGDVLVAFWCVTNLEDRFLNHPEGWSTLGLATGRFASPAGTTLWAGYRTVQTGEDDRTTYDFPTGLQVPTHHTVFVAAFRRARASQPIDPSNVQSTRGNQAGLASFEVPSVVAGAPSAALFAACVDGAPTLPDQPGFTRLESTVGFALYAPKSLLSEKETAPGPHIEFAALTTDAAPLIATASLAIAAQP